MNSSPQALLWASLAGISVGLFVYCSIVILQSEIERLRNLYFPDRKIPIGQQLFMLASNNTNASFVIGGLLTLITGPIGYFIGLDPAGICFVVLASIAIPYIIFKRLREKRVKLLEDQFQPSLLLISSSIRSGQTLTQAIGEITQMTSQPLSEEYQVINREIILGVPLHRALENFANRTNLPDIKIATTAMVISSRTGADLAQASEKIADTIRRRKTLKSKIDAMTTQGKAQGVVAGLAPLGFGIVFYLIDPKYMQPFLNSTLGNILIAVILLLQVCAYFMIRKITDIKI